MVRVHNFDNTLKPQDLFDSSAMMMGNFDGFHQGHAQLADITKQCSNRLNVPSCAATFAPHPDFFFARSPSLSQELLFTIEQKIRAFSEAAIDAVVIQKFDEEFCEQSHEDYFKNFMIGTMHSRSIVIGQNFRFGKSRGGDARFLKEQGAPLDIEVHALEPISLNGELISSTRIRKCLRNDGNVELATELLGRPYLIEGVIKKGQQLGRTLGFPTANLHDVQQLVPRNGVYAGYLWVGDPTQPIDRPSVLSIDPQALPAVINIGTRPSVSETDALQCEANILSHYPFSGELYGRHAGIYLTNRLREEKKFTSLEELKHAIAGDANTARNILNLD